MLSQTVDLERTSGACIQGDDRSGGLGRYGREEMMGAR